jgi:sugar phosphate permease
MDHIQYQKSPQEEPINFGDEKDAELATSQDDVQVLSKEEQDNLMHKVTLRIVPFLSFLYVLSYLDRASLSNVHDAIKVDMKMDESQYANAVGVFFLGYILLGVPSNIALVLVKARVWLTGIMVAWGSVCIVMMFAKNAGDLMIIRFFLGCAEAGFVPGVFLYLTYWYASLPSPFNHKSLLSSKHDCRFLPLERGRQLALFISSNAMAGLVGGLLSYTVSVHLNGVWGLHWWQFLFLIEGASTVAFGCLIFFVLPDSPASAKWLTEREKKYLLDRYQANNTGSHSISLSLTRQQWISMLKTTVSDKFMWAFAIADFCSNGVMITITFFLPTIINKMGAGRLTSNLLSSIPYACALVVMMINAIHSDAKKERQYHVVIPCFIGIVFGTALALYMHLSADPALAFQLFLICIVVACVWAIKGPFLAWMTYGLRGNSAIGIGIVNSIANISGWIGPSVQAAAKENFSLGFIWLGGLLMVLIISIHIISNWERKQSAGTVVAQQKVVEHDRGRLLQEFPAEL